MDVITIIETLLTALIIPLATWAVSSFTSYLKQKANNENLDKYFKLANDAINTAVSETMQTFVSNMKKCGSWDTEAATEALNMAKLKAQEIMGTATYKALGEIVTDVDAWLTSKVETSVLTTRQTTALLEGRKE